MSDHGGTAWLSTAQATGTRRFRPLDLQAVMMISERSEGAGLAVMEKMRLEREATERQ